MIESPQTRTPSGARRRAPRACSGRRGAGAAPLAGSTLALGPVACGGSSSTRTASTSTATTPAAAAVHATLTAPTHTPKVNAPWPYVVRVTNSGGQPVAAVVHLPALLQGDPNPVGQIGPHKVSNGVWSETITWPAASANEPRNFQALATALGQTVTIDYPLQVSAA